MHCNPSSLHDGISPYKKFANAPWSLGIFVLGVAKKALFDNQ